MGSEDFGWLRLGTKERTVGFKKYFGPEKGCKGKGPRGTKKEKTRCAPHGANQVGGGKSGAPALVIKPKGKRGGVETGGENENLD